MTLRDRVQEIVETNGLGWFDPVFTGGGWMWLWRRPVQYQLGKHQHADGDLVPWGRGRVDPALTGDGWVWTQDVKFDLTVGDRRVLAMITQHPGKTGLFTDTPSMAMDDKITDEWLLRAWRWAAGLDDEWKEPT